MTKKKATRRKAPDARKVDLPIVIELCYPIKMEGQPDIEEVTISRRFNFEDMQNLASCDTDAERMHETLAIALDGIPEGVFKKLDFVDAQYISEVIQDFLPEDGQTVGKKA